MTSLLIFPDCSYSPHASFVLNDSEWADLVSVEAAAEWTARFSAGEKIQIVWDCADRPCFSGASPTCSRSKYFPAL